MLEDEAVADARTSPKPAACSRSATRWFSARPVNSAASDDVGVGGVEALGVARIGHRARLYNLQLHNNGCGYTLGDMDALDEFVSIAHRVVWATVATVDRRARPRSRVLHPLWVRDGTGCAASRSPARPR